MTFTRLGDEFTTYSRHLSNEAFRLHVEALIWSNYRLCDLFIPHADLIRFCDVHGGREVIWRAVEELIEAGLWSDTGDGTWYIGHRDPDWQMTAEWVEHSKARNRRKQQTYRERQMQKVEAEKEPEPLTAGPNPTQPNPTQVTGNVTGNTEHNDVPLGCCDDPTITDWNGVRVCRNCGTRGVA